MLQNTFEDKSTLAQVMASGNKPLPEPVLTHISVTIWHQNAAMS